MNIHITEDEAELMLTYLESIPVKSSDAMRKTVALIDKLQGVMPQPTNGKVKEAALREP